MPHPAASTLEAYTLGRLHGQSERKFEEHLLVCEGCRTRLSAEDEIIRMIRAGFEKERAVKSNQWVSASKVLPFRTHLPVYSLEAAAGEFGKQQGEVETEGWLEVPPKYRPLNDSMFITHIVGGSMEPQIPDGSLCAFTKIVSTPYDGKVLLIERSGEVGGNRFTVEEYQTSKNVDPRKEGDKEWLHERITLKPANPDYPPWDIASDEKICVLGEFAFVARH